MKRLLPAVFSLLLILVCVSYLYLHPAEKVEIVRSEAFVSSANLTVPLYREEDKLLHKDRDLSRGTPVISRNREVEVNGGDFVFTEIELEGETREDGSPIVYYIKNTNICDNIADIVHADTLYVRTSATVYQEPDSAKIASYVKKGTELSICGYYGLNEDGSVDMYQIDNPGQEGYVFARYLTDTLEKAEAPYSQVATLHEGRVYDYDLGGGSTETLDWYPYEKPVLSQGPILEDARAIYLNMVAMRPDRVDSYITLAKDAKANMVIVDIKNEKLTYGGDVAAQMSPTSYEAAYISMDKFAESMQKIKEAGLYTVGRIVVFRDSSYAQDHPEECILSNATEASWPSAFSRNCWYYNVSLALEAIEEFGFNEIQFDYLRFPESAYAMTTSGVTDFRNDYNEEKAEAIQNFCFYAADQIHKAGAYLSVDVFGECINEYVTAYGQYWPAISNVVDAISGMPYTDHFGSEVDTWSYPYTTIYEWASKAALRQTEVRTPALARTWITGYDTPNWDPTVVYGEMQLIDQAQALYDSGLVGGFIPWNSESDLNKYYSYLGVWSREYQK